MRLVGFDPGGEKQFGWCVVEGDGELPVAVVAAGTSSNASEAVASALAGVGSSSVAGVGIDSPLFWVATGERGVDRTVRDAIKRAGAPNAGGTVQQVNSLRGACITQGVLAAHLIRRAHGSVRITESHPKALLWLIAVASKARPVLQVSMEHLAAFVRYEVSPLSEHERDAALGALAAWAMVSRAPGWRDLAPADSDAFVPVSPVEYWMPIEASPNNELQRTRPAQAMEPRR